MVLVFAYQRIKFMLAEHTVQSINIPGLYGKRMGFWQQMERCSKMPQDCVGPGLQLFVVTAGEDCPAACKPVDRRLIA